MEPVSSRARRTSTSTMKSSESAGEVFDVAISSITIDTDFKFVAWEKVHELGKDSSSGIHLPPSRGAEKRQNHAKIGILN
jgi:hypothetical protein